jgi:hypothetical protein
VSDGGTNHFSSPALQFATTVNGQSRARCVGDEPVDLISFLKPVAVSVAAPSAGLPSAGLAELALYSLTRAPAFHFTLNQHSWKDHPGGECYRNADTNAVFFDSGRSRHLPELRIEGRREAFQELLTLLDPLDPWCSTS